MHNDFKCRHIYFSEHQGGKLTRRILSCTTEKGNCSNSWIGSMAANRAIPEGWQQNFILLDVSLYFNDMPWHPICSVNHSHHKTRSALVSLCCLKCHVLPTGDHFLCTESLKKACPHLCGQGQPSRDIGDKGTLLRENELQ